MQQSIRCLYLIILALALAACGSGNRRITIKTDGMRFVADEIHIKAGQSTMLQVINRDGYAHAFDIDEFDIHTPLAAQATFDTVLAPSRSGRYRFYCGTPGHAAAGMEGVLVVEP